MSTQIKLKRTTDADKSPVLDAGEPFYNLTDKKLFVGNEDSKNLAGRKHIAQVTKNSEDNSDTITFSVGEASDNTFIQKIDNVDNAALAAKSTESLATGLVGKFTGTSVGSIPSGTKITEETINSLLATLLNVSEGIEPHSFTISNNSSDVEIELVNNELKDTTTKISYTWSVHTGTLTNSTVEILNGTTPEVTTTYNTINSTSARTGTQSNVVVDVPANADTLTITRKCEVNDTEVGTTGSSFSLSIKRPVFAGNTGSENSKYTTKSNMTSSGVTFGFGAGVPYIEWPSYWGTTLKSVVDQNGFDCTSDWSAGTETRTGYTRWQGLATTSTLMSYTFKI